MVLAELVQNAVEHGLGYGPGSIEVGAQRVEAPAENQPASQRLLVEVTDDGGGLPRDFDIDDTTSLGLQIVRTLIAGELNGHLEVRPRESGGTKVVIELPLENDAQSPT